MVLFDSFYLITLLSVLALVLITGSGRRQLIITAGSILFYLAYSPLNMVLVLLTTLSDLHFSGRLFKDKSKALLAKGILVNLIPLLVFKYLHSLMSATSLTGTDNFILPLGLSYITFRKISYLIDLYRGATKNPGKLSELLTYYLYLPSVVAGPIERFKPFSDSLKSSVPPKEYSQQVSALLRIGTGLFKKLAIADLISPFTSTVLSSAGTSEASILTAAVFLYSIEIYMDFSGYTDIALGLSELMGIRLMENFNKPYSATSLSEFWQKWHISLTSWLRDYIFLPCAMYITSKFKKKAYLNINSDKLNYIFTSVLTMTICGIWHGSSFTFIIWGTIHGILLSISFITKKLRKKWLRQTGINRNSLLLKAFRTISTFSIVTALWIPFRSSSATEAFYIFIKSVKGLISLPQTLLFNKSQAAFTPHFSELQTLLIPLTAIIFLYLFSKGVKSRSTIIRWSLYSLLVSAVTALAVISNGSSIPREFIYNGF